jgi:hypothetical protein
LSEQANTLRADMLASSRLADVDNKAIAVESRFFARVDDH